MVASNRRRLFERSQAEHPLTAHKLRLLQFVAESSILTVPQLAKLSRLSEKSVRGHMRDLFDLGLVERIGVPRAALAGLEVANTPELLWGRAPTVYALSKEGAILLVSAGLVSKHEVAERPRFGPKNALFLAHELQVRDVRVWLEQLKFAYPHHEGVVLWRDGAKAIIDLGRNTFPRQLRPDAWFIYRLKEATLVGLVEVDRGTERSPSRWQEKFVAYAALFAGNTIQELTGHKQARVLVIAPDEYRRDNITTVLAELLPGSTVPPDRFWIADLSVLESTEIRSPRWRVPGREELLPFIPGHLIEYDGR